MHLDKAIKDELEKVSFEGTEEDILRFINEKWQYLPQDVKDRVAVTMMLDGIRSDVDTIKNVEAYRNACVEVLKALEDSEQDTSSTSV